MSFKYEPHSNLDPRLDLRRCDVSVSDSTGFHFSQCKRPWVVERKTRLDGEGRRFCKIHDPEAVEARRLKRGPSKYERECEQRRRDVRIQERRTIALERIAMFSNDETVAEAVRIAKDALAYDGEEETKGEADGT